MTNRIKDSCVPGFLDTVDAGKTPLRMRSRKGYQTNKISNYVKVTPQRRTRSNDDEEDVEESKRRKVIKTPTKKRGVAGKRRSPTSPTTPEKKRYADLARKMHKGGSLGQARCEQLDKLYDVALREKAFLTHRKRRIDSGKDDYPKAKLDVDRAIFDAQRRTINNQLSVLDRTMETKAVDISEETESAGSDEEVWTSAGEDEGESDTEGVESIDDGLLDESDD